MRLRLERFSFRFAEQVLNSKLAIKQEIEDILTDPNIETASLSRPEFNKVLRECFVSRNWIDQPNVFPDDSDSSAKMDFLKDRVGIEVGFGHGSFLGIDLLKFQVSSYSGLDQIDVGVYVATTKKFQKTVTAKYSKNWDGSLTYEKIVRYLPHFKSAIQVPIYVLGIDL
jgi:hypothetical protein